MTKKNIMENSKLLDNVLTKRIEFAQAKQEYINSIEGVPIIQSSMLPQTIVYEETGESEIIHMIQI